MRLVLRGATGTVRSTPTATPGDLLGIGSSQNSINKRPAKAYCLMKDVCGVKLEEKGGPRKHISEGLSGMRSDKIVRTYLFLKK